jgi:hypothetical protein
MTVGIMAASRALSGQMEEARRAMDQLRELEPNLRISGIREWLPIRRPEDLAVFSDGLRRAGLPEH